MGSKATTWALCAVALCLVFAAALLVRSPAPREAAGQETTTAENPPATAPPVPASPDLPSLFPEITEAFPSASAEARPRGIPGLSVMDVIGQLHRFPVGGRFACRGPVPADGEGTLWACYAPSEGGQPTHEVTVVGDDPLTVLWVRATVRGTSEEEAAAFFSYVAGLCLRDTDEPLNPEAWLNANVGGGGHVFAGGAQISVYGTEEERTLQVVATGAS